MAIEQLGGGGFCNTPHLLWHGPSVYKGHLLGPVTLTPIAERIAVELSQPVFTTKVHRGWDSNTKHSTCEAKALTHDATNAVPRQTQKKKMLSRQLSLYFKRALNEKHSSHFNTIWWFYTYNTQSSTCEENALTKWTTTATYSQMSHEWSDNWWKSDTLFIIIFHLVWA